MGRAELAGAARRTNSSHALACGPRESERDRTRARNKNAARIDTHIEGERERSREREKKGERGGGARGARRSGARARIVRVYRGGEGRSQRYVAGAKKRRRERGGCNRKYPADTPFVCVYGAFFFARAQARARVTGLIAGRTWRYDFGLSGRGAYSVMYECCHVLLALGVMRSARVFGVFRVIKAFFCNAVTRGVRSD